MDNKIIENIRKLHQPSLPPKDIDTTVNDIMLSIINLEHIYALCNINQYKQGNLTPFWGLSGNNVPTMWIFTRQEYAEAFADKYGFFDGSQKLIVKLPIDGLIQLIHNFLYSGGTNILVNDGQDYCNLPLYNFLNLYYTNKTIPFLELDQFVLVTIMYQMYRGSYKVWGYPQPGTIGIDIVNNEFSLMSDNGEANLYLNKSKCVQSVQNSNLDPDWVMEFDFGTLIGVLLKSYDANVKKINFVDNSSSVSINLETLLATIEEINYLQPIIWDRDLLI